VRAGALRALATPSDRRSAALPEAPILADTVPGFAATTWNAVLAPAGTPAATVQGLSDAIARVLREPGFAARLAELGVQVPDDLSPAAAAAFVAAETRKWDALVASAGIRAE
jgi:tripartite-type tricarboxylate transporter receptor subunit TctC